MSSYNAENDTTRPLPGTPAQPSVDQSAYGSDDAPHYQATASESYAPTGSETARPGGFAPQAYAGSNDGYASTNDSYVGTNTSYAATNDVYTAPNFGPTQPGGYQPTQASQPVFGSADYVAAPVATETAPRRRRRSVRAGAVVAIAALAAGVGGGTAFGVDRYLLPASSSVVNGTSTTVTKVVQGSSSNPDWSATASAVEKSVVSITVTSSQGEAEGSGVVWDSNGDIVTNYHVVEALGSSASIEVEDGNETFTATVVGADSSTDIAVIKVSATDGTLVPITLATTTPTVGEAVMAVGNPLGLSDTVTTGIVSALNRPVVTTQDSTSSSSGAQNYGSQGTSPNGSSGSSSTTTSADTSSGEVVTNAIQTSAAINPGNSGGALVNANGELIGITSSIASVSSSSSSSSTESGSIGIGFAIPVSQVKYVATQLISSGKADHPYLGVAASDGTATVNGATVLGATLSSVSSGSAAATAGLQAGDVVTAVNGTSVVSAEALVAQIRALEVGDSVTITYVRNGAEKKATVKLGSSS